MARRGLEKVPAGRQLSMLFAEELSLLAPPDTVLRCAGHRVAFDVETTGLQWWRHELRGLGLHCPEAGVSHYIPLDDDPGARRAVKQYVTQIAADPATQMVAHNIKFDAHFLELWLWRAQARTYDTAVMAHLYDSRWSKKLIDLERTVLGTETKKERVGNFRGARLQDMPLGLMAKYCINDARVTYEIAAALEPKLEQLRLTRLLRKDMKYAGVLQEMERRGIHIDKEFIARACARFERNLADMEAEFRRKLAALAQAKGLPPPALDNWRSDEQLSAAIYKGIGFPMPKNPFADADGVDRTKFATRGKYNKTMTSSFLLMEKAGTAGAHPLGELIMDMRETDKLLGNLRDYLESADEQGRLHTSFNITGTRTGRLSSSEPNLQNVPSDVRVRYTQSVYSGGALRADEYNLRLALVARPGYTFISLDHKQQEMRLFAIMAQEPRMLEAMRQRLDIHAEIARMVWGPEIAADPSILPVRREWSKTIGFGLIYGMTTGSLQHRLNKTAEEAKAIAEQYWGQFPRIMPFLHEVIEDCKRRGYLRYWSGRVWREENPNDMYKGCNAQVQGGSADVISIATMRMRDWLEQTDSGSGVVSIIHDEVLTEVRDDWVERAAAALVKIMEVEDLFHVPFAADIKVGKTYGSLEKYVVASQAQEADFGEGSHRGGGAMAHAGASPTS